MTPQKKSPANSAAKWALWLSGLFFLAPIVVSLTAGIPVTGKLVAEKLIVGIALFPILFVGFWIWGTLTKRDPMTGIDVPASSPAEAGLTRKTSVSSAPVSAVPQTEQAPGKKPSIWNYIGIGVGTFMLLFLFLPQVVRGTLANHYYLGAAFWVGVIINCVVNISRARK